MNCQSHRTGQCLKYFLGLVKEKISRGCNATNNRQKWWKCYYLKSEKSVD